MSHCRKGKRRQTKWLHSTEFPVVDDGSSEDVDFLIPGWSSIVGCE